MFFPQRIVSIKPGYRVLEVGPGNTPHPRSDVLLERNFDSAEAAEQRGHTAPASLSQRTVYYDGGPFPFPDRSFDYVICSHVLEHVDDVPGFVSELCRVAPRGYLEYPAIYYDYIYNFRVHLNFLHYTGAEILWMRKTDTPLEVFSPVQRFFYRSFRSGYEDMVASLKDCFFEGFEWSEELAVRRVSDLALLCPAGGDLVFPPNPLKVPPPRTVELLREVYRRALRRLRHGRAK